MSIFTGARIVRKYDQGKRYTEHNYRSSIDFLLEDFGNRCAYSLRHVRVIGKPNMEVDHHNPKIRKKCTYRNLFPASRRCNGSKSDHWPTPKQLSMGYRFINCCRELDYGKHIFEDPKTHQVYPVTPAGFYHIEKLDLNAPELVRDRENGTKLRKYLGELEIIFFKGKPNQDEAQALSCVRALLEIVEDHIPPLPPGDRSDEFPEPAV